MAAIPPNTNLEGLQKSANDMIYAAFARGVKHGRYLEKQERIEEKQRVVKQLENELQAAVTDMTELMQFGKFCCYCKHLTNDGECTKDFNGIDTEKLGKPGGWWCWQWRGVEDRDGK